MALLPSVATRVTVELTRYRSAVSEFLAQTLGKSINFLLDKADEIDTDFNTLVSSINNQYGFSSAQALGGTGSTSVSAGSDEFVLVYGVGNFDNGGGSNFVTAVLSPGQSIVFYRPTAGNGLVVKFKKLSVSI